MNPVIIAMSVFIIIAIAAVSVTFLQQQNDAIDTGVAISEKQNDRIREEISFSAVNGTITIHNDGSKKSKVLEVRVIDGNGKIIQTWATNQRLGASQDGSLLLDSDVRDFLRTYNGSK